ncbi:MAG: tetratricopeptide repeat protein [Magnetococcales bacterium]|nr:tetratricopeptide repeat protein [Magnetococcales bacterium]
MKDVKPNRQITVDEAYNIALQHYSAKRFVEADRICTAIVKVSPNYIYAINLLGLIAQNFKNHELAVEMFQKAIAIDDNKAWLYYNLGTSLYPLSQIDATIKVQQKAIQIQPDYAEAYNSLGNALREKGSLNEAIVYLQKAIQIKPNYEDAHYNLGFVLQEQKKLDEAVISYQKVISINKEYSAAYIRLGICLKDQGKLDNAIDIYQELIAINPDSTDAYGNLGNIFKDQEKLEEAETQYKKAISINPNIAEIYYNLGLVKNQQNRLHEATECYQKALSIDPYFVNAHTNLIYCIDLDSDIKSDLFMRERQSWNKKFAEHLQASWLNLSNTPDPEKKLRIGYAGSYFKYHSAANMFGPVILNHNSEKFEIFCYVGKKDEDSLTIKLKAKSTKWLNICELSDVELANQIHKDKIDILVDLTGHMDGSRLLTYAYKPAPIIISAWGYPLGTGMKAMDYIFADPVVIPLSFRSKYTEEIVDLSCIAHYNLDVPFPDVTPPPVFKNGYITFGAFNRLEKNTPKVYELWADLLHLIPSAKLLLKQKTLDCPTTAKHIADIFQQHGISPKRLIFMGGTTPFEHQKAHENIDIMLDPFPHAGGMTAIESLWMGVPVLTCENDTRLRVCASVLHVLGLDGWRAKNRADFFDKAEQNIKDMDNLKKLRFELRNRFNNSVLGNSQTYCKEVEENYRKLWQRWCSSK